MMIFDIIDASVEHAADICRVRKKSWLATYPNKDKGISRDDILTNYDFTSPKALKNLQYTLEYEKDQEKFWVATLPMIGKKKLKIIGFAACHFKDNIMTMLYIDPSFMQRGVGFALWKKAEQALDRKRDIEVVIVSYNQAALNFYKKIGFLPYGEEAPDGEETQDTIPSLFPSQKLRLAAEKTVSS